MKKIKVNIKKVCCLSIVSFSVLSTISSGFVVNPIQKVKDLLEEKKYQEVVTYYGDLDVDDESKVLIDELILGELNNLPSDWRNNEDSYNAMIEVSSYISEIENTEIATKAQNMNDYIVLERKNELLTDEMLESYEREDYVAVILKIGEVDEKYSKYDSNIALYDQSKRELINEIRNSETIAEYEDYLEKLDICIEGTKDSDLIAARNFIYEEVNREKEISDALTIFAEYYGNGNYKKAFEILEKAQSKYPENNKIAYELTTYKTKYILQISNQFVELMEEEKYSEAQSLIESALKVFECDEFRELLGSAREKTDIFYFLDVQLKKAGEYVYFSLKKLVLGDYDEESQHTILSLIGNLGASLINIDVPLDLRDLAYDIQHWGVGDYFGIRLVLDLIGILPIIGALKYLKYSDEAEDLLKNVDEVADVIKDLDNTADIVKTVDCTVDTVDVVRDITKNGDILGDLSDDFSYISKNTDVLDDITDSLKNEEELEAIAELSKNSDTVTDGIKDTSDIYEKYRTINEGLVDSVHPNTGVSFKSKNIDISDGRHITGVFPEFESHLDVNLPEELWKASRASHNTYLTNYLQELANTSEGRKQLEKIFDADQMEDVLAGVIPEGFVWHHNETEGLMQLVEESIHAATHHTGGYSLWGGK